MTGRRVAITGIGVVSPHGCDADVMFDSLMRGESAVRKFPLASSVGSYETIGAAVPDDPCAALPRGQRVASDRISQYALLAAGAAVRDAGLDMETEDPSRVGAAIGTSLGGTISQEAAYEEIFCKGKSRL